MSTLPTADGRPGLSPRRLVRLMLEAVERCSLDLGPFVVLTEAATGPYVVTPVLAALAGARVYALAGATRYASGEEIVSLTATLAELAGVTDRVSYVQAKDSAVIGAADIVTNSGQVRPIDGVMVAMLKPSAVVPLMYESWEYRPSDLDLTACRARGIQAAGTNERHPNVDVFSFLGVMAIKQLHDAGVAVYRSRIVVLCENDFGPFIERSLRAAGADVLVVGRLDAQVLDSCDAVLVAQQPGDESALDEAAADLLLDAAPSTVVVEYWGETDRGALAARAIEVWPPVAAPAGHMAVLPSAVGPEPIIRLQSGGLKVGEVLARGLDTASQDDLAYVQPL